MDEIPQKTKRKRVWTEAQKAQAVETRARKKQHADSPMTSTVRPQTRAEYAKGREPRVPTHGGHRLKVPQPILDEIKARGCTPFLALDDDQGSINRLKAGWWDVYEGANGQQFRVPAGNGDMHVLMLIPTYIREEERALRREKRRGRLSDSTKIDPTGQAPDYLPYGREKVIQHE